VCAIEPTFSPLVRKVVALRVAHLAICGLGLRCVCVCVFGGGVKQNAKKRGREIDIYIHLHRKVYAYLEEIVCGVHNADKFELDLNKGRKENVCKICECLCVWSACTCVWHRFLSSMPPHRPRHPSPAPPSPTHSLTLSLTHIHTHTDRYFSYHGIALLIRGEVAHKVRDVFFLMVVLRIQKQGQNVRGREEERGISLLGHGHINYYIDHRQQQQPC
jgi:hypothetical protein